MLKPLNQCQIKLIRVPGYPSIHPVHRPTAHPPSCNTPPDSCGVFTGCLTYWMGYVKTIELMLDKINMSTRISFNTFWASTDGTAAELQHSSGFLWSIHWMSDILDELC